MAAVRLLNNLRAEYPRRRIFVSCTTLAGRALAEEKLRSVADGIFFAPLDYPFAVRRVLRTLHPSVVVGLETEIWPNWYRETKRTGAGLLVVNGRISDRAFPRYRRFAWFFRAALAEPDAILVQTDQARERFCALGAPPEKVRNIGNLKYDFDPSASEPPGEIRTLLERLQPEEIWVAASTMPPARSGDVDEDDAVVAALAELAPRHPRLLLILVPRRPERFEEAAARLRAAGVPFLRRSQLIERVSLPLPGVLLLDSIGELTSVFPLATIVFMGGTLADRGGHNILEPAACGRAVILGPHMENFPEIAAEFGTGGGVLEIAHPGELAGAVDMLLRDGERRRQIGERARRLAVAKRGATDRAMAEIRHWSGRSVTRPVRPWAMRIVLVPLSWLWAAGVRRRRRRAMERRRALSTPVVSIGGIGMGGVGKTPLTLFLAQELRQRGWMPAILTRGYRRRVPEKASLVEAGGDAPVGLTGDEGQLLLRAGVAHLGIGADRYSTGRLVEERFHPDVFLLDDGFQHWQLARDLDIVLVDALDPLAGGATFPLGRQRESLDALRRASAVVITRVESGSPVEGIRELVRFRNPGAPVFLCRARPEAWIDAASGETLPVEFAAGRAAGAFCGLANPAAFWRSLDALNCRPAHRWVFADHHRYTPQQVKRMAALAKAAGLELLLTTEKDLMNLPPEAARLAAPLRLAWLRIGVELEGEDELLELIVRRVRGEAEPARDEPPAAPLPGGGAFP